MNEAEVSSDSIQGRIIYLRGQRVILDIDLAVVYGLTTKRLNEQIRRNRERFPSDFMFQLSNQEVADLRSQFATANWSMRRTAPYAFTEHGAVMAANVLNSPVAINASVVLVRAFIKLREVFTELAELKRRQTDIERRLMRGFGNYEAELREIRFLIDALQNPERPKKRRIGF